MRPLSKPTLAFVWPLRVNAIAVLILMAGLITIRAETIARVREAGSEPPPLDLPQPEGVPHGARS